VGKRRPTADCKSNKKDAGGKRTTEKLKAGSPRISEEREVTLQHGSYNSKDKSSVDMRYVMRGEFRLYESRWLSQAKHL
jgi:hypothetical protein